MGLMILGKLQGNCNVSVNIIKLFETLGVL